MRAQANKAHEAYLKFYSLMDQIKAAEMARPKQGGHSCTPVEAEMRAFNSVRVRNAIEEEQLAERLANMWSGVATAELLAEAAERERYRAVLASRSSEEA
jgi:hypothetical protein